MWPVALLVRLWLMTIRIQIADPDREIITHRGEATIYILWHNRLFLASEFFRRFRRGQPIYSLISASNDGAWLTAYFMAVGMKAVRGSSSRNGREAASALVEVLRSGCDVGITPDGPRGPVYEMKPGALIVARRAHPRVAWWAWTLSPHGGSPAGTGSTFRARSHGSTRDSSSSRWTNSTSATRPRTYWVRASSS